MKYKIDTVIKATDKGIKLPDDLQPALKQLLDFVNKSRGGYLRVTLAPPFKKRTTGDKSQNHAINGFVTQISNFTGESFDYIKDYAKREAFKRGYPKRLTKFGETVAVSETEIDTIQAGYLIDTLHEIASFLGMTLKEKDNE